MSDYFFSIWMLIALDNWIYGAFDGLQDEENQ